ncbi:MAG: type 2 isopentenyl-diphosphate Delta-isomerase [Ignavibacteria bacterium GWA2_54_16]|nr:MAG: type 2 isopentenyl-diphosphate Delta-isomerase [Ignavibacteria bacterium GWA2_54_16]
MKSSQTSSRKQQHVEITLSKDVSFRGKTSGFERYEFVHNALPEVDFSEVNPSTVFLGKAVSLPFLISSMTGGYKDAERINRGLAEVCAQKNIAMGVGSQRQALEDPTHHRSYSVVREVAPDIPVFGNIGASEVARLKDASPLKRLADLIQADAFAVHLNPLQEFLQPEGDPRFRGVLDGIAMLVKNLGIPLIVKEIGAGISAAVARRLIEVGVRIIDVAGSGGTSWAGVEILRRNGEVKKRGPQGGRDHAPVFWDWGIPTADALAQVVELKTRTRELFVIASGGLKNGLDVAKALALGAGLAGVARPMLKALEKGGIGGVSRELEAWEMELKGAMFLTGSKNLDDLQRQTLVRRTGVNE